MGFLDSVILRISPRLAYEREAWHQQYEEIKSYDAGNSSRFNANWRVYNESAEITDRMSRDTIRARARDLERNSDIANSILIAYKRNVVGFGYNLQARTENKDLNKQIEDAWAEWTKAKNCDVTAQQSFNQMLRMAVQRKKIDGGIIFKKCYTTGGFLPFKLQAFEVDELSLTQLVPKYKGNKVVGGIEYNSFNKPVGYWIEKYSLDGFNLSNAEFYEAKDIIFYYTKNRPSQVREISDFAPSIMRIKDTNEFMNAVSIKERIAACLAVFIKKSVPTAGFGRSGIGSSDPRQSYSGKTLAPGMISELNAGDEIQVVDPKGSSGDATDFLKMQQRIMGAGQGLSYEATSRDMSETNYSSARQANIEDELTFAEEIQLLQENFMTEVYETFIISCYLSGIISFPGFWDRKSEYLKHEWVSSPKKWIDPYKEANANKIALATGQKTFKQIAAENGRDWQSQIDDMAEVFAYAKEKGIELGGVIFGQGSTEQINDDDDDENGKKNEE